MVPRRGDGVCTSRRCGLRHLAAWAEYVILRRQINLCIGRLGVRHPRLQQSSPPLVAGSRQYPRVGEVDLMAFLQRCARRVSLYADIAYPYCLCLCVPLCDTWTCSNAAAPTYSKSASSRTWRPLYVMNVTVTAGRWESWRLERAKQWRLDKLANDGADRRRQMIVAVACWC
ncbi:hypothetical protein SprV_0301289300 [Sparganum proliferum]